MGEKSEKYGGKLIIKAKGEKKKCEEPRGKLIMLHTPLLKYN